MVKTDGLAAGKGVFVTESLDEAADDVRAKLSGASFGPAGRRVVVEEGLTGPELSVLCVCDGDRGVPLAPAQDFKRVGDGDAGPNTGGMGAFSPVPGVDLEMVVEVAVEPTLQALRKRDIDYRGVLYAGLMRTPDGLKVIEFNVRFGDPEAQVVLPRLSSDLAAILAEAANGRTETAPTFVPDATVCVVLAVEGYPESPRAGDLITGIDSAEALDGVTVYCAGVRAGGRAGELVTAGGRVLNVIGRTGQRGPAQAEPRHCRVWPRPVRRVQVAGSGGRREPQGLAADRAQHLGLAQRSREDGAGRRHARGVRPRGR